MIDKLDAEIVDDGKVHPFTVALVRELRTKREQAVIDAESHPAPMNALGYSRALREVIRMIETAKGRVTE